MFCAECLRCGRRSVLGRIGPQSGAPAPLPAEGPVRLRCDLCGGRRVRLVRTDDPASLVAFIARGAR